MRDVALFSLLLCACLTWTRAQDWTSNETLWASAADVTITPLVHWRLAVNAYEHGDREAARQELRKARAQLGTLDRHDPLITLIWLWTDLVGM